jgi:beta-glucosidase
VFVFNDAPYASNAGDQTFSPPPDSILWRKDFLLGTATASYQIEGAIHADGRIPSIWDTFSATPGKVLAGDTGEFACDHYNRWQEDVALLKSLNVDGYRLSIAWPRVMHADGTPNQKGIDFYKNLADALRANGLKVYATLYHWDLPQYLEDRGGWLNRDTAYRFAEYADLISRELAGKVDAWMTLNEPWCSAFLGYANGHHAPGLQTLRYAPTAMHHLLLGHGLAVDILRKNDPGAGVGIVANVGRGTADSDSAADQRAAHLFEVQHNAWVLGPLLNKAYPKDLWELWPGCEPLVLEGDMDIIGAKLDFLGINYYFRSNVKSDGAHGFVDAPLANVERTQMGWEVYPQGLEELLIGFHKTEPAPDLHHRKRHGVGRRGRERRSRRQPAHFVPESPPGSARQRGQGRCRYPWLFHLVADGQLRMGVRLRASFRHRSRRLPDAETHAQAQCAANCPVPGRSQGPGLNVQ